MTPLKRILIALLVGVLSMMGSYRIKPVLSRADIGWSFFAIADIAQKIDPYSLIATGPASIPNVAYPLTAAVFVFPWTLIPSNFGAYILFGLSTALLTYGLLYDNQYWRLLTLLSPSFLMNIVMIQWTPLLMASIYFPILITTLLIKPSMALPVLLKARLNTVNILTSVVIVAISFLIMPDWLPKWIRQLNNYQGFIPITMSFGFIFLASIFLLKRNKQSQMFLSLAIMPQHRFYYDQLWLWTIPQSKNQMLALTIASWIGFKMVLSAPANGMLSAPPYIMTFIYLPAFFIILWQENIPQIFAKQTLHFFKEIFNRIYRK